MKIPDDEYKNRQDTRLLPTETNSPEPLMLNAKTKFGRKVQGKPAADRLYRLYRLSISGVRLLRVPRPRIHAASPPPRRAPPRPRTRLPLPLPRRAVDPAPPRPR